MTEGLDFTPKEVARQIALAAVSPLIIKAQAYVDGLKAALRETLDKIDAQNDPAKLLQDLRTNNLGEKK